MILRRCDKCGTDFCPHPDYARIEIPYEIYEGRTGWRDAGKDFLGMRTKVMDLCPTCATELGKIVSEWLTVQSAEIR
jgi:hypothetical protein